MPTFDLTKVAKIAIIVGMIVAALGIVLSIPYIAQSIAAVFGLGDVYVQFANNFSGYLVQAKKLFNNFFLPGYEWVLSAVLMTFALNWFTRFTASISLKIFSSFSTEGSS